MSEVIRRETDRYEAADTLLTLKIYRDFRVIRQDNGPPANVPSNPTARSRDTSTSNESDTSDFNPLPSLNESTTESSNESSNEAGSSEVKINVQPEDAILWKPANTRQQDLIQIGESGRTWMKKTDYMKIKFNNYKKATRTILMGVFGSRTLATHTRSGKPCPIYKNITNRKVKPQLPEMPLQDIRMEIKKHFNGLADELINESITTKCADEGRKYRKEEDTAPED